VSRRRFRNLLECERPAVGDGAIGTQLQERGLPAGAAPDAWNLERPDVVLRLHLDYAEAGARWLTTNTFGSTAARLRMHGLNDRVGEVNRVGAELAREAAGGAGDVLVLGSIGPTGELLEPLGALSHEEARAMFAEQAAGLAEGGADAVVIETMADLAEVRAAVEGVRQAAPALEVAATMTFDTHGRTMMGVAPEDALEAIQDLGVDVIGGNCGNGPAELERAMEAMAVARADGVLLLAQSNAGLPVAHGDRFRYTATPEVMAASAVRLAELGVDLIGACCGSSPDHVRAILAAVGAAQRV
jgi:methionine synthase I (cobalamin-dependent)